jgi:beta-glucosidase/6-phospho-beta-glucosidase/beta-galactosidase
MPTLFHFTVPVWFQASGGWARPDTVERSLCYVDALPPLDAGVERVEAVNEPNVFAPLPAITASAMPAQTRWSRRRRARPPSPLPPRRHARRAEPAPRPGSQLRR